VTLVSVDGQQAVFEVNGARRTLTVGQGFAAGAPVNGNARTVLVADPQGHYWADGSVNGGAMRFLVDTGATLIALPAADARRIGLDYLNAPRGAVQTANGTAVAHFVKLDRVKIGDITLTNVDAVVQEGGLSTPLLGMSFLNRTDMRRDGVMMTLVRRF
jgi:aspartyl protease family protein